MKRNSINIKKVFENVCLLLIMLVTLNTICNSIFGSKHIATKSITIANNDTLWSIASCICEEANEDLNIQNIVLEIKNINNLKSSTIYSGQELYIPIYE